MIEADMQRTDVLLEIASYSGRGMYRGLDRMLEAVDSLHHPERCYSTVHIAGTNGKGSTAIFLSSILSAAGFRVGLTLSPHVVDYCERIQINGEKIPIAELEVHHELLKQQLTGKVFTYFEWTILLALTYFRTQQVDLAILETGMGGRWDATNITQPLVGAITNVSLDHEQFLGNTLEKILLEKMKIIKPGMDFWTGVREPHLCRLIKDRCTEMGAHYHYLSELEPRQPQALGRHQVENATLAAGMAYSLRDRGYQISDESMSRGLMGAVIPGRLECIHGHPTILLDAAHNRGGIKAITDYLRDAETQVTLLFGCLIDKPAPEMLLSLAPHAHSITLAHFQAERAPTHDALLELKKIHPNIRGVVSLSEDTFAQWLSDVPVAIPVLITGSFYLIGQVREIIKRLRA